MTDMPGSPTPGTDRVQVAPSGQSAGDSRPEFVSARAGAAARWIWTLLSAYALLLYLKGPLLRAALALREGMGWADVLTLLEALVGLGLVGLALWLLWLVIPGALFGGLLSGPTTPPAVAVAVGPSRTPVAPDEVLLQFPHPTTVVVGVWLAILSVAFIVVMIQLLSPSAWVNNIFPGLACVPDAPGTCTQVHYLAVTMAAAGIGSMATTIHAYLEHASEKADFQAKYVPWYLARPILGMLLGAVFFFVLKGGLLATVGEEAATGLNVFGLASVGATVGLFSNPAVEKLREVFGVVFYVPDAKSQDGAAVPPAPSVAPAGPNSGA